MSSKSPDKHRPFLLVTNDDGFDAPGIQALVKALEVDHDLCVVAPDGERSGYSQAITIYKGFAFDKRAELRYAVDGTPADCVVFALFHLLKERRPDWVIAGINRGANLGDDTLYSGTVGAAMEGAINDLPTLAISLTANRRETVRHFDTAVHYTLALINKQKDLAALCRGRVLNLNVPNLRLEETKGFYGAELSRRHYDKNLQVGQASDAPDLCHYGAGAIGHDGVEGNDAFAIDQGFASLTLLKPSFFDPQGQVQLVQKLGGLSLDLPSHIHPQLSR